MKRNLRQPTAPKRPAKSSKGSGQPREVTRYIGLPVTAMLWGRAAGRCEFAGCNQPLWKSPVTQESVNIAQRAHIYSFSSSGPRGNDGVSTEELNGCENLLLVCHACHRKIDNRADGGRYTAKLLRQMKAEHERRIELVTGIAADRRSHVLLYDARVCEQQPIVSFSDAASAMFPGFYPATDQALDLGVANSVSTDRNREYWEEQSRQLRGMFERRVRERVLLGEIAHLSVFAIAPQPLLVLLGVLLGDIVPAAVYQRHREPATWKWPSTSVVRMPFQVREPASFNGTAALVLGLSATVTDDRIKAVLGPDTCIWAVTVVAPHNDMLKSQDQLSEFRGLLRPLFDRIKAAHGQGATLHIFPAMPVASAVELGRVRMPKADMSWQIYDENRATGGFSRAIVISQN